MTTAPIRAVLFDLDGTLVDNMPFHIEAWIETARSLGREITAAEVMRDFAGRRNEEILPALLGRTSGVIAWAAEVLASASGVIGRAGEARAWGAGGFAWAGGAAG